MRRFSRPMQTTRFSVDLSAKENDRLEQIALRLNASKGDVIKRLIDAAAMASETENQRLCICEGDRRVAVIAGV